MKNKTYILKYPVLNSISFPEGIIVTVTDDYWGKRNSTSDKNTGFTVMKGKLKGQKGCVAAGLNGYLLENTPKNRAIVKTYLQKEKDLELKVKNLREKFNKVKPAVL